MTREVPVLVTHLEMRSPGAVRGAHPPPEGIALRREALPAAAEVARTCYQRVGAPWHWHDRADWTAARWAEELAAPGVELWTARAGEALVGFFLLGPREADREVRYFGLVPEWTGRRVGGWLLVEAISRAWTAGPARVVLNTCSLDGPAALPNYLARGFTIEREERMMRTLPE